MSRRDKSIGIFTTDRDLVVQSWDSWMVAATGLAESTVTGQPLARLYPSLAERGLLARLRRVADGAGVDVLAPAFHKYLLPCAPRNRDSRFEHMRQHVTFAPIRNHEGIAGVLVTVEDVTERLDREKRLAADLDHEDANVRLAAAKALAAAGDAPALLANSLNDESWRVRRVAAEGMAGGGHEVVGTLIEALREHHRDSALLNSALTALARTRADVVMDVVPLLDHADAEVRTYAALALGLTDDSRAVPALLVRLDDVDTNVRFHVIEALGRIGDRKAADALAAIAESRDFFLSFAAVDALAAIGESSVAPRLVPLLDDEMLLPAVIACLGAIGTEDVAVPLARLVSDGRAPVPVALALASLYDRLEREEGEGELVANLARGVITGTAARIMVDAMREASDDELRGLIMVLSWLRFEGIDEALAGLIERAAVQSLVAERMATRGVGATPFLVAAARRGSDEARRAAAYAFGGSGDPGAVPTLLSWLNDDSPTEVVTASAAALGAIGDRTAFEPLLALLDHGEAVVRQCAIAALNSIGHPQTEAAVAGRLRAESAHVRESAARIAGYFGYASCLRKMVELCDDPDAEVRRAAVEALSNYDQQPAWSKIHETAELDPEATVRAAAVRALGHSSSDRGLQALVAAAHDRNLWVRYFAIRSMARRGVAHADVLAAIAECLLRDTATPVRIAAVESLGVLRATTMLSIVLPFARDAEDDLACAAIATLGSFDAASTRETLAFALNQEDTTRQLAALDAVARQRDVDAIDTVRSIARTGSTDSLRRRAIEVLGAIGGSNAVQTLVALAADRRMRESVVASLAQVPAEEVPRLEAILLDADPLGRELIVEALGRLKHPQASRVVSAALDDPSADVRSAASRALGRRDTRDALTNG